LVIYKNWTEMHCRQNIKFVLCIEFYVVRMQAKFYCSFQQYKVFSRPALNIISPYLRACFIYSTEVFSISGCANVRLYFHRPYVWNFPLKINSYKKSFFSLSLLSSTCSQWKVCGFSQDFDIACVSSASKSVHTASSPIYTWKLQSYSDVLLFSFSSLSYDRSKASSTAISPHSAIQSFLFQMRVSSPFLKIIQ